MTAINGKTAFVTGAASGIGFAAAQEFAKRGARVMMADIDEDGLAAAKAKLASFDNSISTIRCDVADADSVKSAADATVDRFGDVHIVMNNAGVGAGGKAGEIPLEDWRWVINIDLMGVVYGVEHFVPLIKAGGQGGHIINTASMAGHYAPPGMAPYAAAKFGVVGYSEALKPELEEYNIGVSLLCPGWVKTSINRSGDNRPSGTIPKVTDAQSAVDALVDNGMSPEVVADWLAECVESNRLYVFTHPDMKVAIEMRAAALLKDYEACLSHEGIAATIDRAKA